MNRGVNTRRRTQASKTAKMTEWPEDDDNLSGGASPHHEAMEDDAGEASLLAILRELRGFREDNKVQLTEIKRDLNKTTKRMEEAESRIDEVETVLQSATTLLNRLLQRHAEMDAKLLDQEGRARRGNIRLFCIGEQETDGLQGNDMAAFVETLLKTALEFPPDTDLGIERCHRALSQKPTDPDAKPRSIVAKFASYKMKEEVIRRAWQKKQVFHNNIRFFVDHDYPPAVLKKRAEYAGAKKELKNKKIKFQTPYPAKLRVFYNDETVLYQTAAEATEDMAARGYEVDIIPAATNPDQHELQRLSNWKVAEKRRKGAATSSTPSAKKPYVGVQKLLEFKRVSSTAKK